MIELVTVKRPFLDDGEEALVVEILLADTVVDSLVEDFDVVVSDEPVELGELVEGFDVVVSEDSVELGELVEEFDVVVSEEPIELGELVELFSAVAEFTEIKEMVGLSGLFSTF